MKQIRNISRICLLILLIWVFTFADARVKTNTFYVTLFMLGITLLTLRGTYDPKTNQYEILFGFLPLIEYYRTRKRKFRKGNFLAQCAEYSASVREINDFIRYWQKHPTGCSLQDYLGMTADEYDLWQKEKDIALPQFVEARRVMKGDE